jgi:spore germination cell wall hydrolase CwlJ-like protein
MKRLVIILIIGMFLGSVSQYRLSEPRVITKTDTVEVEVPAERQSGVSKRAANWMARAIYSETKNPADYEYIGWVIRNRMESPAYPGTARAVILQPSQFSAFNSWKRRKELEAMTFPDTKKTEFRRAYRMAEYILTAPAPMNPLPDVTHFYMSDTMKEKYGRAHPEWASSGELAWATEETRYYANVRAPRSAQASASSR